jgi:ATP-binding cassette subfamily F protein uup
MPPILNAQGVSKRFGATPLFEKISFAVNEGDRIGLIGPNGAGKSTLLAVLAGEVQPDAGEVSVRKRARIGYIKQISEYAKGLTVRSVLETALKRASVPANEREQRLRETLGWLAQASRHRRGHGHPARRAAARRADQSPGSRRN